MSAVTEINGVNVAELLEFKNTCKLNPGKADRDPVVVAHWVGGSRSRVEFKEKSSAAIVLECASSEEASEILDTLPLVEEGRIAFDIIPLKAYPGFSRLFAW